MKVSSGHWRFIVVYKTKEYLIARQLLNNYPHEALLIREKRRKRPILNYKMAWSFKSE